MTRESHTYVGKKTCGCYVAAVVDKGDADTRKAVLSFMKSGLAIERVSTDEARKVLKSCRCEPEQPGQLRL